MSPLVTARFLQSLRARTDAKRSKKTNWAKTLTVLILSGLAAGGTVYAFTRLAALTRAGVPLALARAATVAAFPQFYLVRSVWRVMARLLGLK